jgi:pimeloyl-ACP methyl ester carboxylesterase
MLPAALLRPFGRWGMRRTLLIVAGLDARAFGPTADHFLEVHREFRHRRDPLPIVSDARLSELTMPVLVIAGEQDAMIDSADTARRLARAVPHAVVTLLPGTGHAVIGQAEPILAFLRASPS